MTEHPILFSALMVRAILAGDKTVTRRIVKPQPDDGGYMAVRGLGATHHSMAAAVGKCPYGVAGDRLWVRETWCPADIMYGESKDPPQVVGYPADKSARLFHSDDSFHRVPKYDVAQWNWEKLTCKPSIHMPRWASRLTLGVVSVRVERLHDIDGDDVRREGMHIERCPCDVCARLSTMCPADESAHLLAFMELWDSLNAKRAPWASNPWVWRVAFKRVDGGAM